MGLSLLLLENGKQIENRLFCSPCGSTIQNNNVSSDEDIHYSHVPGLDNECWGRADEVWDDLLRVN